MPLLTLIILALVQGITEFLPISSSGHLVVVGGLLEGGDEALAAWDRHILIDIAVHIGTLFSVLLYFWRDVLKMFCGLGDWLRRDFSSEGARLNINVLIGSIPVIIAGFILHALEPPWLLSIEVIAWSTVIFGILLWVADRAPRAEKQVSDMGWKDALIIGIAQSMALVPGTSRSGITMTAGRFLGYSRTESAHFSLLLSIIAIAGAGVLSVKDLMDTGNAELTTDVIIAGFVAFASALAMIAFMMKFLEKFSFAPFAIYRVVMGCLMLGAIYFYSWG
ncbi:MAG: undecaprenyl-diphosphate phosphatase [Alphaproteobacteria bacterium]|nr:undecaprenyl-diphosphate phosphatase [Alphaproteobacteria bacterium]MCD8520149.1 undecaprenyl-diphosphate phosphatase [Alphaproteobacteria bacterium]MCD8571063.1 undecaprenyl-diphosphate phosphatase [Alphaproteobacteria bacterium]